MAEEQDLKKRIELLETTLRDAKAGFEMLHTCALKGFTDEAVLHCVHQKIMIDRVLPK